MAASLREFVLGPDQVLFMSDLMRSREAAAAAAPRRAGVADRVRDAQRRLDNECWAVGLQKQRAEELEAAAAALTRRHELKRRRSLEAEAAELRREIEDLESGARRRRLQDKVEPFLREAQRQQFCRPQPQDAFAQPSWETEVLEEFQVRVEGAAPKFEIQQTDSCAACGDAAVQLHPALSMLVCQRCGAARPFLDATSSLLGYAEDSNYDFGSFSYKRINHFSEWLASIQAKETLDVPQETLRLIMERLAVERVAGDDEVTAHKVREVLKKLKLRKYYEHVQLIACKLSGRAPPRMTPEMEERLKVYFMAASASFQRNCPPDKKNLTSYGMVLYKLCELLGYKDFLPCFPAVKGVDKMQKMEQMWAKICQDLDWECLR